uniref:Solute-binding protein family 5 domain-containing protein n=1 Tax=Phenylobacterium glaciei TaxID=2803784 RepID=A0A974S7Q7_9CAUL|nr:hypothetical protein JKL49_14995 [Phenylobacterium glaciei]
MVGRRAGDRRRLRLRLSPHPRSQDRLDLFLPRLPAEERPGGERGQGALTAVGARAIDAGTLELTLEHPAPYLPELLKHQSFFPVPKHAVEKWGDAWVKPGRYVSNGPYKLMSWQLGDHIEVVKNPYFYDAKNVCVDRIDYFPTPTR